MKITELPQEFLILYERKRTDNNPRTIEIEYIASKVIIRISRVLREHEADILEQLVNEGILESRTYGITSYTTDVEYEEGTLEDLITQPYEIIIIYESQKDFANTIVHHDGRRHINRPKP